MQLPLPNSETLLMPDARGSLFIPPLLSSLLGCSSAVQWARLVCIWVQQRWVIARCRTLAARLLLWLGFGFPHTAAPVWDLLLKCSYESRSPGLSPQPHGLGTRTGEGRTGLQFPPCPGKARTRGPQRHTGKGRVGASPALLMWSCRRQLKRCWDKESNEPVWLGCICSRVIEKTPGC